MSKATRYAGQREVFVALVDEGFPEEAAQVAAFASVPADDDDAFRGWMMHLTDARAEALRWLRSQVDTMAFNIGQLEERVVGIEAERRKAMATLAKLSPAAAGDRAGRMTGNPREK